MRITPFFGKAQDFTNLHPDMEVFTLRHTAPPPGVVTDLLCDQAWTTKGEIAEHHWIKQAREGEHTRLIRMTLEDYLKAHWEECKGMNAFWDVGRLEWLQRYTEHKESMEDDNQG